MKVTEFKMLVHGPFATNIYVDLGELEELKRLSLNEIEIQLLKYIKCKPRTEKNIVKELLDLKFQQEQIMQSIDALHSQGYLEFRSSDYLEAFFRDLWNKTRRRNDPTESKLSPTLLGLEELMRADYFKKSKNSLIDKNFLMNFSKNPYLKKVKVEEHQNSYRQFHSYFFSNEVQAYVLAKFSIEKFLKNIENKEGLEGTFEFGDNTIHLFASGIGIFSSQVTVRFYNEVDIAAIKQNDLEAEVKNEIGHIFTKYISPLIERFSRAAKNDFQLVRGIFEFEPRKVSTPAWLHTIYWFYDNQILEDDRESVRKKLNPDLIKDFTALMGQLPDNISYLKDRYLHYGWGKSLVLTDRKYDLYQEWVNKIGSLIEIGQYFCFGLNLLEYFLSKKISQLMIDEPIIEQHPNRLKYKIEDIEKTRSASIRYLEQFRSGIKALVHTGQTSLVDKIEKGWRLEWLENDILTKLDSLEKELAGREQSLIVYKQDRFSNIAFIFTVISLASVMGGVVALSPLEGQFKGDNPLPFLSNELFFVIFSTTVVIGVTMYLVMKSHGLRQKLSHKSKKLLQNAYQERNLKNAYYKKIDNSPRLYEGKNKDVLLKHLNQIRNEANILYSEGKISKADLRGLDKSLDDKLASLNPNLETME